MKEERRAVGMFLTNGSASTGVGATIVSATLVDEEAYVYASNDQVAVMKEQPEDTLS